MPTGIPYCDEVWNMVAGCSAISESCENCWACRLMATRLKHHERYAGLAEMVDGKPQWTGEMRVFPELLVRPLHWRKPRVVFVASQFDLFHPRMPMAFLEKVLCTICYSERHAFLVLTKRPQNAVRMLGEIGIPLPPNLWLGVSVENQKRADERIPVLLQTPAAHRWVSLEPLLGPVDLRRYLFDVGYTPDRRVTREMALDAGMPEAEGAIERGEAYEFTPSGNLDCVIVGGESGPGARPMHPDWVRSVRDQCAAAGVPFYFKQWGEWLWCETQPEKGKWENKWNGRSPGEDGAGFYRVGKKAAGRTLDGREHNELPWRFTAEGAETAEKGKA